MRKPLVNSLFFCHRFTESKKLLKEEVEQEKEAAAGVRGGGGYGGIEALGYCGRVLSRKQLPAPGRQPQADPAVSLSVQICVLGHLGEGRRMELLF